MKPDDAESQDHDCHDQKRDGLVHQIKKSQAFEDDPADDLDKIGQWNHAAQIIHKMRHGFPRKNESGKQNGRGGEEHDNLGGLLLVVSDR